MNVYRIVKDKKRTTDLSGTGAFNVGGRWNSKGTYMLYTSENSSLALLESLVHFDKADCPRHLYITQLQVDDPSLIYTVPVNEYPLNWIQLGLQKNKVLGDRWMADQAFLGIRVKSAINVAENNILLNPLYPGYHDLIKIASITQVPVDERMVNFRIN